MSQPRKCLSGSQESRVESHVSCLPRALRVREIARHLKAGKSLYTQVLASQLYSGVGETGPTR